MPNEYETLPRKEQEVMRLTADDYSMREFMGGYPSASALPSSIEPA
jgi:hypothetical protein